MTMDRNAFIKLVRHDFSVFAGSNKVKSVVEWLELLKEWADSEIEIAQNQDTTTEKNRNLIRYTQPGGGSEF